MLLTFYVGAVVLELYSKRENYFLVNYPKTVLPTEKIITFLSFSDNLLQDVYILKRKKKKEKKKETC